jgi:hypothetical protein
MPDNCGTACPLPLEVWDGQNDADSCTASGSAHLSYYSFAFGQLSQCLNIGAGAYHFGYRFKQAALGADDAIHCEVDAYAGSGCNTLNSPLQTMTYNSGPASTSWASPSLATTFVAPSGTGSIYVLCGQSSLADTWIDQIYLGSGTY